MPFSAASACSASIISGLLISCVPSSRGSCPRRCVVGPRWRPSAWAQGPSRKRCVPARCPRSGAGGPPDRPRRPRRAHRDARRVGRLEDADHPPVAGAVDRGDRLDLDLLADRPFEVRRRAQVALEPGAGDLERVGPRDGVDLVEEHGRSPGWPRPPRRGRARRGCRRRPAAPGLRPRRRRARAGARRGWAGPAHGRDLRRSSWLHPPLFPLSIRKAWAEPTPSSRPSNGTDAGL